MDNLLSSREENRHFDDGLEVILSFKEVASSAWLLMLLKVYREMKAGTGICRVNVTHVSNRVEWWLWCAI